MIKLKYDCGYEKRYQFSPNHDRRRIYGGFVLYEQYDKYEIWALGIIGEQRNKGYGTQMLTEFLEQFNADKPLFLYVYKTNKIAIRLYEKVGFKIVGDYFPGAYAMQYMNCA
jgi:ribosomal protein S18 acetylase RimI-like enzyme